MIIIGFVFVCEEQRFGYLRVFIVFYIYRSSKACDCVNTAIILTSLTNWRRGQCVIRSELFLFLTSGVRLVLRYSECMVTREKSSSDEKERQVFLLG